MSVVLARFEVHSGDHSVESIERGGRRQGPGVRENISKASH